MKKKDQLPHLVIYSKSALKTSFFDNLLRKEYQIHDVKTEEALLTKLTNLTAHLIIIDEKATGRRANKICQQIRHRKEYAITPILLITTHLKKSIIKKHLQAGASDFIGEPLDEDEIYQRIETAKRLQRTEQKVSQMTQAFTPQEASTEDLSKRIIIFDRVMQVMQSAHDEKNPLSLLLIELEDQRRSKALHAHLEKMMRPQDVFTELGAGRFMVIMPKTSKSAALFIAENIQDEAKQFTFTIALAYLEEVQRNIYLSIKQLLTLATSYLAEGKKSGTRIITKGN